MLVISWHTYDGSYVQEWTGVCAVCSCDTSGAYKRSILQTDFWQLVG